jgi:hypothetical protein
VARTASTVEHVGRREERESGVVALIVVPAEEVLQVRACAELALQRSFQSPNTGVGTRRFEYAPSPTWPL